MKERATVDMTAKQGMMTITAYEQLVPVCDIPCK